MISENRRRLDTKALVLGYAMSRLDSKYLAASQSTSWSKAFVQAGLALGIPAASLKNLRDEFDPFHGNARYGWHKRPLRPSRQRIMGELCDLSDEALIELVSRILCRDEESAAPAIDALVQPVKVVHNVAERLLTGRRAEEWFLANCESVVNVHQTQIIDLRQAARGYDFGVSSDPSVAIEVKGLKGLTGQVLFTDHEWGEAKRRGEGYWLVVVGNLAARPLSRVWRNPVLRLVANCRYVTSVAAVWTCTVGLTG